MAKAVLVMEMPVACLTCKGLGRLKGGFLGPDKWYCKFDCVARYIDNNSQYMTYGRPDWCPLIKLPDRNPDREVLFSGKSFTMEDINDAFKLGEDTGWNAFIDYLEDKTNE